MQTPKVCLALLFLLLLCISLPAYAQAVRGRIEGKVKDPQGQVIPNATLTITNAGTGEALNATSSGEGFFVVPEVKPAATA